MHRLFYMLITLHISALLISSSALGQTTPDQPSQDARVSDPAWAKSALAIPLQDDSHWIDNRWQSTHIGPFLTASIDTPAGGTLKGIAIRVGDGQEGTVCFDTARLSVRSAWVGDFLKLGSRRFGLLDRPVAGGKIIFSSPDRAGWARNGRFEVSHHDMGWPGAEQGEVHLPKTWAHYRGLYLSGQRVVLAYSVAGTNVFESPWMVRVGQDVAFTRTFEIGPHDQPLRLMAAGQGTRVSIVGRSNARVMQDAAGVPIVDVPPSQQITRFKLVIVTAETEDSAERSLRMAVGGADHLSEMIADDTPRWPDSIITEGTTSEAGGPYVIDTLTLPFDNPYRALWFTSGLDFFTDGRAAICTVHGDVWTVHGIDRDLKRIRWRRYATGLFQPLGLKIVDDKVYVIGRDQITRLHDRNGDGEADHYENFNNDIWVSGGGHNYVTCLDTDPDGNFYFIHADLGVMRVSRDGSNLSQVADGFRNPNGMAVGPQGQITAAPQQGSWTPESSIVLVKPGGYYGYGGPRITAGRPTGWDLPLCFVPRALDNSGGAQVWVEGSQWGPLEGQMLHLSFGQCRLLLTLFERVGDSHQGGSIKFPTVPADFESGIMRGRFNPIDGQLYVSGLRGWQTRAVRDGCFQRLRYTGGPIHLPSRVETFTNGIRLSFTDPLDPDVASNPDNYFVEQWNYSTLR